MAGKRLIFVKNEDIFCRDEISFLETGVIFDQAEISPRQNDVIFFQTDLSLAENDLRFVLDDDRSEQTEIISVQHGISLPGNGERFGANGGGLFVFLAGCASARFSRGAGL